ncbi:MAG: hypothetical protein GXP42_09275 [Chloroflexi bacterium]|nr:hypothetical protein [Chloroflexota bacterium]
MSIFSKIIHNGEFIAREQAVMPVYAPALVGALGVYETILARRGRYIALEEHLTRLFASASGAKLNLDVDIAQLKQWCYLLLAANHPEGLVRVLVMDLGHPAADIFLYQMTYEPPSAEDYVRGTRVILYHGERALPPVKSFNTLVPGLARKAAREAGAHDALLVDRNGYITEGSNCNVFAVMDGTLFAPPSDMILEGTVMNRVIRLAEELAIPFQRRLLALSEVPQWQEAFLTSTRRGVLPIRQVGEHKLGEPGPITRRLREAYLAWEESVLTSVAL